MQKKKTIHDKKTYDLACRSHTGTFAWQIPRVVFYNLLPVISRKRTNAQSVNRSDCTFMILKALSVWYIWQWWQISSPLALIWPDGRWGSFVALIFWLCSMHDGKSSSVRMCYCSKVQFVMWTSRASWFVDSAFCLLHLSQWYRKCNMLILAFKHWIFWSASGLRKDYLCMQTLI